MTEEQKEKSSKWLKNITNIEELRSIEFWNVDKLPKIVTDYIIKSDSLSGLEIYDKEYILNMFPNLADVFKTSDIYKLMRNGQNGVFNTMTDQEILDSESGYYLRDIEKINNDEEFDYVLESIEYWGIDFYPKILIDYLLSMSYDNFTYDFNTLKDIVFSLKNIYEMQDKKLRSKILQINPKLSCGDYHFIYEDENNKINIYHKSDTHEFSFNDIDSGSYKQICAKSDISGYLNNEGKLRTIRIFKDIESDFVKHYYTDSFIKFDCERNRISSIKNDGILQIRDAVSYGIYIQSDNFSDVMCGDSFTVGIKNDKKIILYYESGEKFEFDIEFEKIICTNDNVLIITKNGNIECLTDDDIFCPEEKFINVFGYDDIFIGIRENFSLIAWRNDGILLNVPSGEFLNISCSYKSFIGLKSDGKIVTWSYLNGYNSIMFSYDKNNPYIYIGSCKNYKVAMRLNGEIYYGFNNPSDVTKITR